MDSNATARMHTDTPLGPQTDAPPPIPDYLNETYWWAYVHPNAVTLFERPWLVDLILWGNYRRLRDAALAQLGDPLPGRTLQVACCYGDLTEKLLGQVQRGHGTLDVVDVLPVQLENLRKKIPAAAGVSAFLQDSSDLKMPDATYDQVILFFLLHEQPEAVRRQTLAEAFRVTKPGGRIVIVDFARPAWWNPLRYTWLLVLSVLEPFAPDLWRKPISTWLPRPLVRSLDRTSYFGGLYQKLIIRRV